MILFANCVFLALLFSNLFWQHPMLLQQQPKPPGETTITSRVIEFVCLTPLCCWVITLWVGAITWLFFIGDNGSLFHDFFHYVTFPAGLGLAALMAFGVVRKSPGHSALNAAAAVIVFALVTFSGYSVLPAWDGLSADEAALRIAHRRPVLANQAIVPANQYSLVATKNPNFGGPFSSFDRTYLLVGPNLDAIGRVIVRPFLPGYWTRKRSDDYVYAEQELQNANTAGELARFIDKYPGSKAAATAEQRYARLFDPKPPFAKPAR